MLDGWYETQIHIKSIVKPRKLTNVESYHLAYMAVYERDKFQGAVDFLMYCEKISVEDAWQIKEYVSERVQRIDD